MLERTGLTTSWEGGVALEADPLVNIGLPLVFREIGANIAMAVSAILTIRVNRKFLPKEYRSSAFREVMLVGSLVFFGFFFVVFLLNRFFGLKF